MREYKFKAWWSNTMCEVSFIDFEYRECGLKYWGEAANDWIRRTVNFDEVELLQYTGIKERYPQMAGEGREIYFGDVVRVFGGEYCQGYYEHDQVFVVKNAYDIVMLEESENVKLLGNMHENPELLKEGNV